MVVNDILVTKGKLEYAKRRALNIFDKWNDTTGFFNKHSGYYYEILGVIEDAVQCGIQVTIGLEIKLDSEE